MACNPQQNDSPTADNNSNNNKPLPSGYRKYEQYCTLCHGADGKYGFGGAANLAVSVLDKTAIKEIIKNGKKTMTPFAGILSEKEIDDVTDYIITLRQK